MEDVPKIIISNVREIIRDYTTNRIIDYLPKYSEEIARIGIDSCVQTINQFQNKGIKVELNQIFEEKDSINFIKNLLGPAVGTNWLFSGKQIKENINFAIKMYENYSPEVSEKIKSWLKENGLESAYSLDKIVSNFERNKKNISNELKIKESTNSLDILASNYITGKYLRESVRKHFCSSEKFSKAFEKKYTLHRILQGDYLDSQNPSELNKRKIMLAFNEELASRVISDFSSSLFISNN